MIKVLAVVGGMTIGAIASLATLAYLGKLQVSVSHREDPASNPPAF